MYNKILLVVAITILAVSNQAVGADDIRLVQEDINALVQKESDGYHIGSFLMKPEASISSVYDSNIFATRNDEVEDDILVISPSLNISSVWDRHKLALDLGGNFGRYSTFDSEDYDDYWIDLDGRFDMTDKINIFGGLGYSKEHEDRGSPDDNLTGKEPTTFDSTTAYAGISHSWDKIKLRLGGTNETLEFDNSGSLRNKDRNRDLTGIGLRLTYALHPEYSVYGQGIWDKRAYDERTDDSGFQRDSDGYRADIGMLARFSNRLKGEFFLGVLQQDYDDPRFSSIHTVDFGGNLNWRAAPRTTMTLSLDRSLEETTLEDSSGYLHTSLGGSVRHELTPRININASVSAAKADYQSVSRNDEYYSARIGMRYYPSPRWYLGAEYRLQKYESDVREDINNPASSQDRDDYDRNQLFFTVGVLLHPVKPSAYWDMPSGETLSSTETQWQGLYGGIQLGYDTLNLDTKGGRDKGIDKAEYSNSDTSTGLFAGYGISWGRWFTALELDYEDSNTDIYHRKSKLNSRTVDVKKDDSYGLAIRGGYQLATGSLLYGRVGAARTDFDVYTTVNDKTEFADDSDHTETGVRLGIGTDIPISEHMFVRLDYTYTDYDSFDANIIDSDDNPQSERYNPGEDIFHIGLGWQFDGFSGISKKQEIDYTGLYSGTHLGHGAIQSDATGSHTDSGPVSSSFTGDFGDDSALTAGVFFGYGVTLNNFYLGLEGELEDSNAEWDHERSPNGRNFSVEKMGTLGLSLRGGYVLNNGSLLYAHLGRARTRFNTTWVKGGERLNDVDRDDTVTGTRFGIGAELPLTRTVFARLDYSYTDYDSYDFVTSHDAADSMKFDNNESLFRLGLMVRF